MKVKIKPSDEEKPPSEVTPEDGEKVPVAPGDTVQFEGEAPIAAVPFGLDLVLIYETGTVVLEGFFNYGEGEPPSIDLGGGKSLFADYGFHGEEGPIGVLFSDGAGSNALGYEPFSLSTLGTGGVGSPGLPGSGGGGLGPIAGVIDGFLSGLDGSPAGSLPQFVDAVRVQLAPFVCTDGHVGSGFGSLTLTTCDDIFTVTARANNVINASEGDDNVAIAFSGPNLDVQDNAVTGGDGNDTVLLSASGGDGTSSNDSDVERNTVIGDGGPGEPGDDDILLEAKNAEGDVGRNTIDAGEGNNQVRLNGFTDVEFNTVLTGDGNDAVSSLAGANFLGAASLPKFNVIALDLPGGDDAPGFETFRDGMVFNAVGDAGLDNVSWVNRSDGSDNAVLAIDRDGDGQISRLNEIDFFPGLRQVEVGNVAADGSLVFSRTLEGFANREVTLFIDFNLDLRSDVEFRVTTDANGFFEVDAATAMAAAGAVPVLTPNAQFVSQVEIERGSGLEGLRQEFDSNDDGVFDANDAAFGDFLVWQDGNADGRGTGDELRSLADLGIRSIDLVSDGSVQSVLNGQVVSQGIGQYQVTGELREFRILSDFEIETAPGTGGDIMLAGTVALPNAVVRVVLDLDLDGGLDVGYEVMSDGAGNWTLDTAVDVPVGGAFVAPAAGANFDFQTVAIVTDANGQLKISGVSTEISGTEQVQLDLDLDGTIDVTYTVVTDEDGRWNLDTTVDTPTSGSFTSVFQNFNFSDASLVAVTGGESSQRGDSQNNTIDTRGGDDTITVSAHQDVQSNTIFAGAGNDSVLIRSDIDDVFTNEVFLGRGADSAVLDAQENVFDNVVRLGLNPTGSNNRDSLVVEGDRIGQNVFVGGDDSNDVVYVVVTDENGNWTLNTAEDIPVGALAAIDPLPGGTLFDVNAAVTGATVVTTEEAVFAGAAVIEGVAAGARGNATVKVGLDLDQDGNLDVEYEVRSDQNGFWTLDTAVATPVRGSFVDLTAGQMFDVSQITLSRDDVTGRPEVTTEFRPGDLMVSGTVDALNSLVKIAVDLDQDGTTDVTYDVMSDGAGIWNLDSTVDTPVSGAFIPLRAGQAVNVSATTFEVSGGGQVKASGVSTIVSGIVMVGLDLDQDGVDDVSYEVMSDPDGKWSLDTAVDDPATGTFTPLAPMQNFDVSADAKVEVFTEHVVVTGVAEFSPGEAKVGLDLDRDGVVDVEYNVVTDGAGNWSLDTAVDVPVRGAFTSVTGDQFFDVVDIGFDRIQANGRVFRATKEADGSGEALVSGVVDTPNAMVKVGLDLDQNGTVDVTYDVASNASGEWTLNTAMDASVSGDFVPLTAGQSFNVSAAAFEVDGAGHLVISGVSQVISGTVRVGLDFDQDGTDDVFYDVLSDAAGKWSVDTSMDIPVSGGLFPPVTPGQDFDISADNAVTAVESAAGEAMASGTVDLFEATVIVELDLDQDGNIDVTYEVMSDETGMWSLDAATETPVSGTFTAPAAGEFFNVSATASLVDGAGQVMVSGVSTILSGTVSVGLDLDQDGTDDVTYEVLSDAAGKWTLNTATEVPTGGGVLPGQGFDVSTDGSEAVVAIVGGGGAVIQGISTVRGGLVKVALNLDQDIGDVAEVEYHVITDAAGNWTLNTLADTPVKGEVSRIDVGQSFDWTQTGFAVDDSGDLRIEGRVDLANAMVTVGVDLDQDGTDDVTYEVRSDSDGKWVVDTNGDALTSGVFSPLMPAQSFNISADKAITTVESVAGEAMASGTVDLFEAKVIVELDLDQDGNIDVTYEVMSDETGMWSLDAATETPVSGTFTAPAAGESFDVSSTAFEVNEAGEALITGVSTILSGTVTVGLDLDQDGTDDVVYEVLSDSDGKWKLDTDGDEPTSGTFAPLVPEQAFNVSTDVLDVVDGGLKLAGKVDLANATVTVALNLDKEGADDVVYQVTSDAQGNWAVDSNQDIPTSGILEALDPGQDFDVSVSAVAVAAGDFQLQGEVDLTNAFVTVRIVLDLVTNQADPGAVEFEVQSDADGIWRLDTATDFPSRGIFTALEPGQTFSVMATPFVSDTVIEGQIGVPGGGTELNPAALSSSSIDINEMFDTTGGTPILSGDAGLADAKVTVVVDLDQNGAADVTYEVVSDGAGLWKVDTSSAIPVAGTFVMPAVGQLIDVAAVAVVVDEAGEVKVSGISNVVSGLVAVGLDLDQDTTVDVVYEVLSDGAGRWFLDSTVDVPTGGVFTPLPPAQDLNVDTLLSSETFVGGSGSASPVITGTSILRNSTVEVGLNFVNGGEGGDNGDDITLKAIGEINDNEIFSGAGDDVVRLEVTGEPPTVRPPDPDVGAFEGGVNGNFVLGRSGDDTIEVVVDGAGFGAAGNDLRGGTGVDTISVKIEGDGGNAGKSTSKNSLFGEDGDDVLTVEALGSGGNVVNNEVDGGAGGNTLTLRAADRIENNILKGGEASDTIRLGSLDAGVQGLISGNNISSGAGNDFISLSTVGTGAGGFTIQSNTIDAGAGDDVVELSAGPGQSTFSFQFLNAIDGGTGEEIAGDTLRLLGGGDVAGNFGSFYNVTNFEILDLTNGDTNIVGMPFGFFDKLTGGGLQLTILGDGIGAGDFDTVNFGGLWDVVGLGPLGFTEFVDNVDDGVTRTLLVQDDLATDLPIVPPVVLDLDGNGLAFDGSGEGMVFDLDGDGDLEATAWASTGDAVLAYDRDADGLISERGEFAFAEYLEGAATDLEGLRNFDTNANGLLDAGDDAFGNFYLWQENNFDGVGSGVELASLADAGVESINLETEEGSGYLENDVLVRGVGEFTFEDGSKGALADAAFLFEDGGSDREIDFGALAGAGGGDGAATTGGANGAAGLVAEQLLDVSGSEYAGVLAAVDALGGGDGSAITPLEMSMARVGAPKDGMEAPVGSPGPLVEGEAAVDDGLAMA